MEQELKVIEKELVETREQVESLNRQRKGAQEGVRAEMEGLDATWRTGVGRVLEVEVASEQIRRDILEARRKLAAP